MSKTAPAVRPITPRIGALVDGLGGDWGLFFILTAIMVIPSLLLLWKLRYKLQNLAK